MKLFFLEAIVTTTSNRVMSEMEHGECIALSEAVHTLTKPKPILRRSGRTLTLFGVLPGVVLFSPCAWADGQGGATSSYYGGMGANGGAGGGGGTGGLAGLGGGSQNGHDGNGGKGADGHIPGSSGVGGAGGSAGTAAHPTGRAGGNGSNGNNALNPEGGGGGGGGGGDGFIGQTLDHITQSVTGGNGGNGGDSGAQSAMPSDGGSGGGGGAGAALSGGQPTTTHANVTGGSGGNGGATTPALGGGSGYGGNGGSGIFDNGVNLSNSFVIKGGSGGNGGDSRTATNGRAGGAGGSGVTGSSFTLLNSGSVEGGNGGRAGTNATGSALGTFAAGGMGISGANLRIINAGAIAGGMGSDGVTRANAISFTGGNNQLELQAGWSITGNVVGTAANGASNSLVLGGDKTIAAGPGATVFDVSKIAPQGTSALQYQGFSAFEKTGTSTWRLANTTSTVTPWIVSAGALEISDDSNLGSSTAPLTLNGGTLATTANIVSNRGVVVTSANGGIDVAPSTTLTLDGVVAGGGGIAQVGRGTTILNAANSYTGGTAVVAGTLVVGDAAHRSATLGSGAVTVSNGAALGGYGSTGGSVMNYGTVAIANTLPAVAGRTAGSLSIRGDLMNHGLVTLASPSGQTGNVLNVAGNYSGVSGTLAMNTEVDKGGGTGRTDRVVIMGTASGSTAMQVHTSGSGARTVGDGIQVVEVQGDSSAGAFHLAAPVQAGAYQYLLYRGGASGGNDWFLRSQLEAPGSTSPASPVAWRPGVVGYALTPLLNVDYGFSVLGRLQERVGDVTALERTHSNNQGGIWARMGGQNLDENGTNQFTADERTFFAQFGKDWTVSRGTDGSSTHAGVTVTFGTSSASFEDTSRDINPSLSISTGTLTGQAQSVGGYWTRYLADGTYIDGVAQLTHYHNRYGDIYGGRATQNGFGTAVSAEVGKPWSVGSTPIVIEPQAQLSYQYVDLNGFDDGTSAVSGNTTNALRGRVGVRFAALDLSNEAATSTASPYLTADVLRDFFTPGSTSVGGTPVFTAPARTWYEVGFGTTSTVGRSSELYFNVKYARNIGGQYRRNIFGQGGYRYSW
jgi:outer membrane autotransporter protein